MQVRLFFLFQLLIWINANDMTWLKMRGIVLQAVQCGNGHKIVVSKEIR